MAEETEEEQVEPKPKAKGNSAIGKMLLIVLLALVSSAGGGVVSLVLISRTLNTQARATEEDPKTNELRERVRRLLADQLIIAPPSELHARTRMVSAFVGPTGVGKTTTIAKIAGLLIPSADELARYVLPVEPVI